MNNDTFIYTGIPISCVMSRSTIDAMIRVRKSTVERMMDIKKDLTSDQYINQLMDLESELKQDMEFD